MTDRRPPPPSGSACHLPLGGGGLEGLLSVAMHSVGQVRETRRQFSLGPAGQVELPAAVAAVEAERQAGPLQREQSLGFGREAPFPCADAQPCSHDRLLRAAPPGRRVWRALAFATGHRIIPDTRIQPDRHSGPHRALRRSADRGRRRSPIGVPVRG